MGGLIGWRLATGGATKAHRQVGLKHGGADHGSESRKIAIAVAPVRLTINRRSYNVIVMSKTGRNKRQAELKPHPVRLKDVAAEAGVSVAAASMVLNQPHAADQIGATCTQRVREIAARLGYVPNHHAQAMRGRRTGVSARFPYPRR